MKPAGFYFVLFLCVVYAGLVGLETHLYQSWERALNDQRAFQMREAQATQYDRYTEQLMRRTVSDSFRDPGVADLLKKLDIKVIISSSKTAPPPPSPFVEPTSRLLPATNNAEPLPPTGD